MGKNLEGLRTVFVSASLCLSGCSQCANLCLQIPGDFKSLLSFVYTKGTEPFTAHLLAPSSYQTPY